MIDRIDRSVLAGARVLVVGDAMLDRYWHGAVERISPEAPVPVVKVSREEERIGAAANVAYNVATLGAQASFLGVGDDEPGRRLEALLQGTGIGTHLKRDPGLRTTVKLRVIGRQQQLLRMDFENEPDHEMLAAQTEAFNTLAQAQAREVFDVTGAGDTVIATLAAMAAAGLPPRDAVSIANRAGGIVVGIRHRYRYLQGVVPMTHIVNEDRPHWAGHKST